MDRDLHDWPDQAERERRAAKARRWTLYLAGLAAGLMLLVECLSGCGARDFCRDAQGRFVRCPSKSVRNDADTLAEMTETLRRTELKAANQRAEWDAEYRRQHGHGEPIGAETDNAGFWRCRDADGITWESKGECD